MKIGQFIDIPDANSVVPIAKSLLEFLPGIGGADGILTEMTNLADLNVDFQLADRDYRAIAWLGECSVVNWSVGAGWQSPCGRFRAAAGYTWSAWFNALTADSWIRSVQENGFVGQADALSADTLTFDGLTARAEYRF